MDWIWYSLIVLTTFVGMEFVAWATHKYVMHGFLWTLHEDHHVKDPDSKLEKNDAFFLIFAIPSWLCIMLGMMAFNYYVVSIGAGIAVYGFAYFVVHEVFIHQRIRWLPKVDSLYWRAVRRAHKMHHRHLTKEDGESFGMLFIHPKYIKQELDAEKRGGSTNVKVKARGHAGN